MVQGLAHETEYPFSRLGEDEILEAEADGQVEVQALLKLALRSERDAAELAGSWMHQTQ